MNNTYIRNETSPQQLIELKEKIYKNSKLKIGDVVKLKGDVNSPLMVISSKSLITKPVLYPSQVDELNINYGTTWYNKSKQDFVSKIFIEECLEKIINEYSSKK